MMTVFAGIALVLAASGVYGVVSYTVASRTHEIGVRMALGAAAAEVRRQIVIQALRPAFMGIVTGTATALALSRLMSSALYGVVPLNPATFATVGLILAASALLAAYIPARRAAAIDPIVALREE
jgi:putative ABC transport system permease protein